MIFIAQENPKKINIKISKQKTKTLNPKNN